MGVGKRVARGLLIAACLVLVMWPFFQHPGTIFYNRYFEASLVFNPGWTVRSYLEGWSYFQHLGYATLTEVVYLSIQTFLIWGLHAVTGTALVSRLYPALIQAFLFLSFFFYATRKYQSVPYVLSAICSLFFAVNPITAAAIHEGYSGMLVDYALFPWTLLLVDYAAERRLPILLAIVPLAYTATSMFKFPEIAINLVALAVLRWRDITSLLRESPRAVIFIFAALAVNLYWAVPVVLNAAWHASLPIQADTQSEVAVTTQYSTLSNVVLGRVFGIFGSDAHLCSGCGYYEGAYFNAGMLAIVIIAAAGLARAGRRAFLSVAIAAIVLGTGYHYQDWLIGVPYQILMGLPTAHIFRAANVFSLILFFCYAVGLLEFAAVSRHSLRRVNWYSASLSLAVVAAGLPLFTGSIFEHGPPPQPTFFVRVPKPYYAARKALDANVDSGVTLLLPNQGFANYRWGAQIQDFLPSFIGRPSISEWYWRQPSSYVQTLLDAVTDPKSQRHELQGALRSMRIDSVFIHNDVTGATAVRARNYGSVFFHQAPITLVRPPLPIAPMYEIASSEIPTTSALTAAATSGNENVVTELSSSGKRPVAVRRISPKMHARPIDLHLVLGAFASAHVGLDARVLVVNQSFDPSWKVWARRKGHYFKAPSFVANGYANGWKLPGDCQIIVVNVAQAAFLFGCLCSLLALAAVLFAVSGELYRVNRVGVASCQS